MIGTNVLHYRVTGTLGVGGMGVVYEAEDTRLSRRVALKFLSDDLADDPDATRRLEREARIVQSLRHPGICTTYGVDNCEGRRFLVMERLDGVSLKLLMTQKTLGSAEIAHIGMQVADALAAAHARGVVHRDVKPGNLVVSGTGRVKVLDFGLARRFELEDIDGPGVFGSTMTGRPLGTANYMAPERILQMPLDPRCDLFSLGVVIYEMATGRLPFAGSSPSETVTNVLEREAPPLRQVASDRPEALERIVQRLLSKRADDRYQSAAKVRGLLAVLATGTDGQ